MAVIQLVTPGQAAHRAAAGAPLGGASPDTVWETNFSDDQRDAWERTARHAIRQFNAGSPDGITPGHIVFDSGYSRGSLSWIELPESHRAHYERIAQAAIDTLLHQEARIQVPMTEKKVLNVGEFRAQSPYVSSDTRVVLVTSDETLMSLIGELRITKCWPDTTDEHGNFVAGVSTFKIQVERKGRS